MKIIVTIRLRDNPAPPASSSIELPDRQIAGLSADDLRLVIEDAVRAHAMSMVEANWSIEGQGQDLSGDIRLSAP